LKTKRVEVRFDSKNGKISFSTPTGQPLLAEDDAGVVFTDFNDAGVKTFSVSQAFTLDTDVAINGLGQQQKGKMVQHNLNLHMVQGNTDDYIPFFLSVKDYDVFWDNYSPTVFEDGPESTQCLSPNDSWWRL
jgi:alpha-D-xyloside xylohydrolase